MKNSKAQAALFFLSCFLIHLLPLLLGSCTQKDEPIKIGIAATITGTSTAFGINVRNGVLLAVEEVNKSGGIEGRKIELIIKDDMAEAETALKVDRELIEEGVVAIIGHYSSHLAVKTVKLMNENNMLMISPTVSTAQLSTIDDNFIRLVVPVDRLAPWMAEVCLSRMGLSKMTLVYDISNADYTKSLVHHFKKRFETIEGKVSREITFNSKQEYSAEDIVQDIISSEPDGVLILSNAINTAVLCQHLRKLNSTIKIITSGWSFSDPDFISYGGPGVEGVIGITSFNNESESSSFLLFKKRYEARFDEKTSLACQMGYEAAKVLFSALRVTDDPAKLKETILKQKVFQGLDSIVSIDEYGDPYRTVYILEIKNGKVRTIGDFNPHL